MQKCPGLFGRLAYAALVPASILSFPAAAQEIDAADNVYDGDYLSVGVGGAFSPSYSGSDDYVFTPVPVVQGSLGGVDINPRAGGVGLDFVPAGRGVDFDVGVAARLRSDRAVQIEDPLVAGLGKLKRAIEVGPTVGVGFGQVLNPYDGLTFFTDVLWDVNGSHGGMVVAPSVTYFTPLSQGLAASLSLSSEWADGNFHEYYYQVSPTQSLATGGVLPAFVTGGSGFTRAGATLLFGFDLNGDLTDGGWAMFAVSGYSRMLGDAKRTPFTRTLGSADQFLGAVGIGYTF